MMSSATYYHFYYYSLLLFHLGYDQYDEIVITRQVIIGGKNKYMINGANIQANRVADFFRSVQLNVNNPHFLIMQGRITKVLNMKPPEVCNSTFFMHEI